jgi:3D (Asp-Asp-Asp) domain-containing protein
MPVATHEAVLPVTAVRLSLPGPPSQAIRASVMRRALGGASFCLLFVAGAVVAQSTAISRMPLPAPSAPAEIPLSGDTAEAWLAEAQTSLESARPARAVARPASRPEPALRTGPALSAVAGVRVLVTAYASEVGMTDDSPNLTSTNTEPRQGTIALSQDLLRSFTPGAPFDYGDVIEAKGLGRFRVEDTMHPRWTKRADIWFPTRAEALRWGARHMTIKRADENAER